MKGDAVSLGDIFPFITGAGGALFVMLLGWSLFLGGKILTKNHHDEVVSGKNAVIVDKDKQISDLIRANDHERARGDTAIEAARTSRELIAGLQSIVKHS